MSPLAPHRQHCCEGCSSDAGSSSHIPTTLRSRRRILYSGLAIVASMQSARAYEDGMHFSRRRKGQGRRQADTADPPSLGQLIKRHSELQQRASSAPTQFDVNVTPPKTCAPMNITFNTADGTPPYSVFIAFENWYGYSVSLPATYADNDVTTWLYQFDVPYFGDMPGFSHTPYMVATVGDSSGRLLNSSILQQVQEVGTSCAGASGYLPYTFYTENNTAAVCSEVTTHWGVGSTNATTVTSPMDLYLLPSQQPPVHYPITNATLGTYIFTLALQAGTGFMLTLNNAQGSGGVSGRNLVGIDENIGQACLTSTSTLAHAMPMPTATLSADARMPDFSGVVSSIVTSNGVVATETSVQVVKHGSLQGNNIDAGEIAGVAIGIAAFAAIVAALASWCVWRRRHGRQTVFWDVPHSAEGELSKSTMRSPIDRVYLKSVVATRQQSSNGSMTAPMLTRSPRSESSEERERRTGGRQSEVSFGDADAQTNGGTFSSRYGGGNHSGNGGGGGYAAWSEMGSGSGSLRYNSVPTAENGNAPAYSATSTGTPRRPSSIASTGTRASNPFIDRFSDAPPMPSSSARAYLSRNDEEDAGAANNAGTGEFFEVLPMVETNSRNQAGGSDVGSAPLMHAARPSTTAGSFPPALRTPTREVVQHRDAGLLMDDSLDDEDQMGRIELPPSYHQIQRPGRRDPVPSAATRTPSATQAARPPPQQAATAASLLEELDLGNGLARHGGQDHDDDESEFWRTPSS